MVKKVRKSMTKLTDILSEANIKDPSKAVLQDCKALFTSYANTTNNKSSLERLYKKKDNPFLKSVLDGQKFSKKTLYRGIVNWKGGEFKKGKKVKFGFDGWSDNINIALQFTGVTKAAKGNRILFVMEKPIGAFLNLNSFGNSLQKNIKMVRPDYDFDDLDLNKMWDYIETENDPLIEKLSDVYRIANTHKHGRGESETITEPQSLRITQIKDTQQDIPSMNLKGQHMKIIYVS